MYNLTDEFFVKHIRPLGNHGIHPFVDMPHVEDDLKDVIHRAGIILQARKEEMGHEYPNTVMFMYKDTLEDIGNYLGVLNARNAEFDYSGRINWIVTWTGTTKYEVIKNAAGFGGNTNNAKECYHYRKAHVDHNSTIGVYDGVKL